MNKKRIFWVTPVCLLVFCFGFISCDDGAIYDDPDTGGSNLWDQIKNKAWVKEGDSKPSIGFYAPNKGPLSTTNPRPYSSTPYFYMKKSSSFPIYIDRDGKTISGARDNDDLFSFDIDVDYDMLTISNWKNSTPLFPDVNINGKYTLYKFNGSYEYNWDDE